MREKNIFELIIEKQIPANILYEDDQIISFTDIKPLTKGHMLVVPKKYSETILDMDDETLSYLMLKVKELASKYKAEHNAKGFQIHINNGKIARQEVPHVHVHIIFSYEEDMAPKTKEFLTI